MDGRRGFLILAHLVSADHNLRLKADHSPRLGHGTVVQREQFVIY